MSKERRIVLAVGLVVVVVLAVLVWRKYTPADPWQAEIEKAQAVVLRVLKAPDSAEFPPLGDSSYDVERRADGTVEVSGLVSAVNPLGVRLRHPWRGGEVLNVEVQK